MRQDRWHSDELTCHFSFEKNARRVRRSRRNVNNTQSPSAIWEEKLPFGDSHPETPARLGRNADGQTPIRIGFRLALPVFRAENPRKT